jgi:hypothetical protein
MIRPQSARNVLIYMVIAVSLCGLQLIQCVSVAAGENIIWVIL